MESDNETTFNCSCFIYDILNNEMVLVRNVFRKIHQLLNITLLVYQFIKNIWYLFFKRSYAIIETGLLYTCHIIDSLFTV